jgi:hypothetical protein
MAFLLLVVQGFVDSDSILPRPQGRHAGQGDRAGQLVAHHLGTGEHSPNCVGAHPVAG